MANTAKLHVTLWPSFPHFERFAKDPRLAGIRINSAMMALDDLDAELAIIANTAPTVPLYFDVKGRQLRIAEVEVVERGGKEYPKLRLNHPISVVTPTPVLLKAGEDNALLTELSDDGYELHLTEPPYYNIKAGESICIRDPSLVVNGPLFTDVEYEKIAKVKKAGFTRYYLSFVERQADVEEFLDVVGRDQEVMLKIENPKGLAYVQNEFVKQSNLVLVVARGDLYVEIDKPHEILAAHELIISKDPEACVGSRILLSVVHAPVPSCSDFLELAWLYDHGFRSMLLCDELCLKEDLLSTAVNVFDVFRQSYPANEPVPSIGMAAMPEPRGWSLSRMFQQMLHVRSS